MKNDVDDLHVKIELIVMISFIRDIDIVGNLYIVTIHQVHFLFDKHVIKK